MNRKRLFGKPPQAPLGDEGYTEEVHRRVYAALRDQAAMALRGGLTVLADATFTRAGERTAIANLARDAGVPFSGLWLLACGSTRRPRRLRRGFGAAAAAPRRRQRRSSSASFATA